MSFITTQRYLFVVNLATLVIYGLYELFIMWQTEIIAFFKKRSKFLGKLFL